MPFLNEAGLRYLIGKINVRSSETLPENATDGTIIINPKEDIKVMNIGNGSGSTNTDTKVTNTLAPTTKAYITGTTDATTNTGTQVFDTGVYLDTTAGTLVAKTFKTSTGIEIY